MPTRPRDTTAEARERQQQALSRIGPAARVQLAIELSEAVRELRIEGLRWRHANWSRAMAVRHIVSTDLGIDLPERS